MQKEKLTLVKVGGKVLENSDSAHLFLSAFSKIEGKKILVHGGGVMADQLAAKLNIPQTMIDGRRVTNQETMELVTMVYAGLINKKVVAQLQSMGTNALGVSGADANIIQAHKRVNASHDYGFVGDIDQVNSKQFNHFLHEGICPVLCAITHDGQGQLLNTNADTIARETAAALASEYEVQLIFCFELEGVKLPHEGILTIYSELSEEIYRTAVHQGDITGGMIPKLDNGFNALHLGVSSVLIGSYKQLNELVFNNAGTKLCLI